MIINFYRLYGIIFFTIDEEKIKCVYNANTHDDLSRQRGIHYIDTNEAMTDHQAREWFKRRYPNYKVNKINKHYHTEYRSNGDRWGD